MLHLPADSTNTEIFNKGAILENKNFFNSKKDCTFVPAFPKRSVDGGVAQ